jgi:hypothetical protein
VISRGLQANVSIANLEPIIPAGKQVDSIHEITDPRI